MEEHVRFLESTIAALSERIHKLHLRIEQLERERASDGRR